MVLLEIRNLSLSDWFQMFSDAMMCGFIPLSDALMVSSQTQPWFSHSLEQKKLEMIFPWPGAHMIFIEQQSHWLRRRYLHQRRSHLWDTVSALGMKKVEFRFVNFDHLPQIPQLVEFLLSAASSWKLTCSSIANQIDHACREAQISLYWQKKELCKPRSVKRQ